jgi:hypothetical protein
MGLKLAEYDFEITHRPGKKHMNVDVLSGHVPAAVRKHDNSHDTSDREEGSREEMSLSKVDNRQAQAKDEFYKQTNPALYEGKLLPYFWDEDSVLYHESTYASGKPKILIPISLREQVIRQHHDPVFAGHQGEKRTLSSLRVYSYWPSMSKDVENFVRKCDLCAKIKGEKLLLLNWESYVNLQDQ